MNVGIIVPGFSASERDWCIPTLLTLVRHLAEEHHVRIFALRYPHRCSRYSVFGADVYALGGADCRGLAKLPLLWRAVAAVRREHRRLPFDVLHAFWADEPGYVAVRSAGRLGVPTVVTLLGGELVSMPDIEYGGRRSRLNQRLASTALRRATHVTAGSTYLASQASSWKKPTARFRASRVATPRLVPIGVDFDRFSPGEPTPSLLKGGTKLLHVGSLVPVKDHQTLLRAFALVRDGVLDAALHLVGSGPLEAELRHFACELGVGEHVVFHGEVPHDALPDFYRSADLLVSSSRHEGQGWVTQEAAGCARTTVGTRVGVVPDLEPATLAVPVRNPEALARAVCEVLIDRSKLSARGELARTTASARHSLAATLPELINLYGMSNQEAV